MEIKEELIKILIDNGVTWNPVQVANALLANGYTKIIHAHWDDTNMLDFHFNSIYRCSICKNESLRLFSYCPECGARMDGNVNDGI